MNQIKKERVIMKWFFNLNISAKLLSGFITVALIAGAVGAFGIINLKNLDKMDTQLYQENTMGIVYIQDIVQAFLNTKVDLANMVLNSNDKDQIDENIISAKKTMDKNLAEYDLSTVDPEDRKNMDKLKELHKTYILNYDEIINSIRSGKKLSETITLVQAARSNTQEFELQLNKMAEWNVAGAKQKSENNTAQANRTIMIMTAFVVAAIIVSIGLGMLISRVISKPILKLTEVSDKLATGNIDVRVEANTNDEIGKLASSFRKMIEGIKEQVVVIEKIADGDMTVKVNIRSDKDIMNQKLEELLMTNNQVFGDIRNSADQVDAAASQVASGSQMMAQGATEQASTVEEINASIGELAFRSKENANNSRKANELSATAKLTGSQGTEKMKEMMKSMSEINEASGNISKIIKVIDEIAFQTNILALNAAVEAARAGAHGKGFAVVAEEVRNLAARSSEAAKETTELIEGTIKKTELGTNIAKDTADAINSIMGIIGEVANTIDTISNASNEQAAAVSQISQAIEQVSSTTQTNSATAEESAAASEELSGQAALLKDAVARFRIKGEETSGFNRKKQDYESVEKKIPANGTDKKRLAFGNSNFGKY
jgi:methyl-accepting chemotaxis protein